MNRDTRRLNYLHKLLARIASGESVALKDEDATRTLQDVRDEIDQLVFRIQAGMVRPIPRVEITLPGGLDG